MSDEPTPVFQIQRVYLKDLSLEQPNSPAILYVEQAPQVDIQLGVAVENVSEGLVEVKQAGLFEIRNLPADQMGPIVGIACPQIVYPYLRGNVADVIQRAGFPPVHLSEINFQAMYEQQMAAATPAA